MKKIGWFVSIAGAITCIVSMIQRDEAISSYSGYGRYYNKGGIEDAEITLIIGLVILIVGVLIVLAGYLRKNNDKNKFRPLDSKMCLKCGSIVSKEEKFCSKCGNNLSVFPKEETKE